MTVYLDKTNQCATCSAYWWAFDEARNRQTVIQTGKRWKSVNITSAHNWFTSSPGRSSLGFKELKAFVKLSAFPFRIWYSLIRNVVLYAINANMQVQQFCHWTNGQCKSGIGKWKGIEGGSRSSSGTRWSSHIYYFLIKIRVTLNKGQGQCINTRRILVNGAITVWNLIANDNVGLLVSETWLATDTYTLFTRKNSKNFLVLLTGFEPSTFGSPVQRSNHWANPSPRAVIR